MSAFLIVGLVWFISNFAFFFKKSLFPACFESLMKKKSANAFSFFQKALLEWDKSFNTRELPWKYEQSPYLIWLSEVILQQTRAEQGLPYYLKFKAHYPTIHDLANAHIDNVLRDWQGLGYYSRARNLHQTAKIIAKDFDGKFPDTYEALIKLKGIGNYTASAIASFAFGRQNAVLDGNVIRVLARFLGIDTPFDSSSGKKEFREIASETMGEAPSAVYNQAIMDFGAEICTPKKPACDNCPLSNQCFALRKGLVPLLPFKQKKLTIKNRYFYYIVPISNNYTWIRKREGKDIWNGLWEFPLVEKEQSIDFESYRDLEKQFCLARHSIKAVSDKIVQKLTHQKIQSVFVTIDAEIETTVYDGYLKIQIADLADRAFPKSILSFIRKMS
jgi:A/G-specific adenine glycosylase